MISKGIVGRQDLYHGFVAYGFDEGIDDLRERLG